MYGLGVGGIFFLSLLQKHTQSQLLGHSHRTFIDDDDNHCVIGFDFSSICFYVISKTANICRYILKTLTTHILTIDIPLNLNYVFAQKKLHRQHSIRLAQKKNQLTSTAEFEHCSEHE